MNTSSSEYRTEALKLILFAERTEWAAKHGKLNEQGRALDEVDKKDSEVSGTKDAGTSLLRLMDKTRTYRALKSETQSKNMDPRGLESPLGRAIDPRETKFKSLDEISNRREAQLNNRSFSLRPIPPSQSSVNPGKMDLIASAQNSTELIKTLLGDCNTYTLPHPVLAQRPDLLGAQTSYADTFIGLWTPCRLIPGNYASNAGANVSDSYSIPLQSSNNGNNGYFTSSDNFPNGTLRQNSSQGGILFKAPVPVVKNQTLPKFKQSSQKIKSNQTFEPSKHGNPGTETASRSENLGYKDKVKKKKPKSLKRMNSIAKKYKL
ncbi:hypothetical protein HG537_0H01080 [Torulaspora globosa]|uniref:Uncharacterized protein n=1 Tax=Torulaspora globosa TaxID=48254 RepID=A0A7H9HZJ3_9SACH|nr:hypothetical protein HG537_0H01080 [Torulaspora sp. CBS 2947]